VAHCLNETQNSTARGGDTDPLRSTFISVSKSVWARYNMYALQTGNAGKVRFWLKGKL
jgi:hypothetical protein